MWNDSFPKNDSLRILSLLDFKEAREKYERSWCFIFAKKKEREREFDLI